MASRKVWFSGDAEVSMTTAYTSAFGTTDILVNQFGTADEKWCGRIKNVKITQGTRDIKPINVMCGIQLKQEDRPEMATLTFNTAMYPTGSASDDNLNAWLFGIGTALTSTGNGYWRFQGGEKTSNDRTEMAVIVKMSRPGGAVTDTVYFILNYATVTEGPVTLDSEGHAEQEWTVKCMAADFYIETGVVKDPSTAA